MTLEINTSQHTAFMFSRLISLTLSHTSHLLWRLYIDFGLTLERLRNRSFSMGILSKQCQSVSSKSKHFQGSVVITLMVGRLFSGHRLSWSTGSKAVVLPWYHLCTKKRKKRIFLNTMIWQLNKSNLMIMKFYSTCQICALLHFTSAHAQYISPAESLTFNWKQWCY